MVNGNLKYTSLNNNSHSGEPSRLWVFVTELLAESDQHQLRVSVVKETLVTLVAARQTTEGVACVLAAPGILTGEHIAQTTNLRNHGYKL